MGMGLGPWDASSGCKADGIAGHRAMHASRVGAAGDRALPLISGALAT